MKKPTFEEVKLVHTRLSTVTFLPRGTIEDITQPIAESEFVGKSTPESKVPEVVPSVPQLAYCRASKNLFAACLGGDLDVLKALLADINGDYPAVGTASYSSALNIADSSTTADVITSLTLIEEELSRGVEVTRIEEDGPTGSDSYREEWDLQDVLNMPESFEDMSTCLHLASERG